MYNKRTIFRPLWLGIIVFSIILVLVIGICIYIYNEAISIKNEGMGITEEAIVEQTSMVEVETIDLFTNEESFHVISGVDEHEQEKIIFYPLEGKQKHITTVDVANIVSDNTIREQWKNECEQCTFIHIKPGIIKEQPLWELAYYDDNQQYVIEYFSMDDGTRYERIRFSNLFHSFIYFQ